MFFVSYEVDYSLLFLIIWIRSQQIQQRAFLTRCVTTYPYWLVVMCSWSHSDFFCGQNILVCYAVFLSCFPDWASVEASGCPFLCSLLVYVWSVSTLLSASHVLTSLRRSIRWWNPFELLWLRDPFILCWVLLSLRSPFWFPFWLLSVVCSMLVDISSTRRTMAVRHLWFDWRSVLCLQTTITRAKLRETSNHYLNHIKECRNT